MWFVVVRVGFWLGVLIVDGVLLLGEGWFGLVECVLLCEGLYCGFFLFCFFCIYVVFFLLVLFFFGFCFDFVGGFLLLVFGKIGCGWIVWFYGELFWVVLRLV